MTACRPIRRIRARAVRPGPWRPSTIFATASTFASKRAGGGRDKYQVDEVLTARVRFASLTCIISEVARGGGKSARNCSRSQPFQCVGRRVFAVQGKWV